MTTQPRGLRIRLMLLVLVAVLPAFAVIGYFAERMRDQESERRQAELLTLAKALAEKHRENLDEARLLLLNLLHVPEIRLGAGPACAARIAGIHALVQAHVANLFVVRPNGDVRCSARDPEKRTDVADMAWFQKALASNGFRVGEYHNSRRTGAPTLTLTHTLREGDRVVAIMVAALDLSWLAAQPYLSGQPAAMAYAIFDNAGNQLLRQPAKAAPGHNIAGHRHWRTLSSLSRAAVFRGPGGDDVERLFAYAPLGPAARPYARLVVGIPPAVLEAPARELFLLGLAGLVATIGLSLLIGWFGGTALVIRPLRPVLDAVQRMANGDLSARVSPEPPRVDEISRLAREVDRMAEALSRRDQALTEARDRAQAYLDVVGVMVLVLNAKGNVALANRKACQVLGCEAPRPCVGGNWFDHCVPEEEREASRARFVRVMAGEEAPLEFHESQVLTARGQKRLIAWHVSPLTDKAGRGIGLLCAGEDVTEIRQTQQALLESGDRYKTLVENIPGVVYRCAPSYPWRMEFISPAVAQVTGIAAARFLDHSVRYGELVHPDDLGELEQAVRRGIAERRPYASAYRIRHSDGGWRWMRERGQAMYDDVGRAVWLDGVILDITEHKAMQEEQERLRAQLQQAQKMEALGQLTGGIAHDFNNILASVLGFTRLALRRHVPDPDGELAEYLREVIIAGERAHDLVARMLTFSRSQPGLATAPLAPQPLLREAVKMLAATIPAGIRIDTQIDTDIPDIVIDPVDLHQILVNLVINARDALDGKGRIVIGLASARPEAKTCATCHETFTGDFLALTVADDGQGIAPEHLTRIFEPFFTTKAVGKGSGMGLAMVHGLVHRAGGHVLVESRQGEGSVFHVYLPVAPLMIARDATSRANPVTVREHIRGHALVVDDEAALRRLLRVSLETAGWRVSDFANPVRALAAFRASPDAFDAIISDQAMPGMSGLELILAIHETRPKLPAILCTGYGDGLDDAAVHRADLLQLTRKPADPEELLAVLREALAGASQTPGKSDSIIDHVTSNHRQASRVSPQPGV